MMKPKKARTTGGTKKTERPSRRLRVVVAATLPLTAAGLQSLLEPHSDLDVTIVSGTGPQLQNLDGDVLVIDADEHDSANGDFFDAVSRWSGVIPVVALVANPTAGWLLRALHAGIRGLLPHGTSGEELASALRASASGLVVLCQEFNDILHAGPRHDYQDDFESTAEALTPREQEVLEMMAEGLLNKEIADRLHVSEHTIKFHVSSIMGKLGASSRTEAVTRGLRRGLLFL